jgi:hypothetical protein
VYEDQHHFDRQPAGISGSVTVNHLWPVVAGGGGMTKDEALDLALAALERMKGYGNVFLHRRDERNPYEQVCEAITAIKQARLAPVQEPFGYLEIEDIESHSEYPHNCRSVNLWHEGGEEMVAIYITPPAAQRQWTGLTDEEVYPLANEHLHYQIEGYEVGGVYNLARAIEAKLKAKNSL